MSLPTLTEALYLYVSGSCSKPPESHALRLPLVIQMNFASIVLSLINAQAPGGSAFFPYKKYRSCEGSTVTQHREIYLIMVGGAFVRRGCLLEKKWYLINKSQTWPR